jgi:hypothetical protein
MALDRGFQFREALIETVGLRPDALTLRHQLPNIIVHSSTILHALNVLLRPFPDSALGFSLRTKTNRLQARTLPKIWPGPGSRTAARRAKKLEFAQLKLEFPWPKLEFQRVKHEFAPRKLKSERLKLEFAPLNLECEPLRLPFPRGKLKCERVKLQL